MGAVVAPGVRVATAAGVVGALVGLGMALGRTVGVAAGEQASRASASRIDTKKMRFIDISYCKKSLRGPSAWVSRTRYV